MKDIEKEVLKKLRPPIDIRDNDLLKESIKLTQQKTAQAIIKRIPLGCGLSISHDFGCPGSIVVKELKKEFGIK